MREHMDYPRTLDEFEGRFGTESPDKRPSTDFFRLSVSMQASQKNGASRGWVSAPFFSHLSKWLFSSVGSGRGARKITKQSQFGI